MRSIKAFVKELKELLAFRKLNKENEEINVPYTKLSTLLQILVTLFVEAVVCVIFGLRRLSGVYGQVQRRTAGGVYWLF